MSKRKSRDDVEPPREFPNNFPEYSGSQLVDAGGKVEILQDNERILVYYCDFCASFAVLNCGTILY